MALWSNSCWNALLLGAWLLSVVSASRFLLKSSAGDYIHEEVHPLTTDDTAVLEDYRKPGNTHVHLHPQTFSSISMLVEDYPNPGQNLPSPHMPPGPWSHVHPSTLDSFTTLEEYHSANPGNELVGASTLKGTHINKNFILFISVVLEIGDPNLQILVGCSCSNGSTIPRFLLDPDHGYQIIGAGETWTCQFFWSANDQNLYTQEFIVFAPPAKFNHWKIDTKGFDLLEATGYVHIHDWIQSPEMSPQMNIKYHV